MTDAIVESGTWASEILPPSWNWVNFGVVFSNVTSSDRKLQQQMYSPTGHYPVVDQGIEQIGGFTDDETLLHPDEPPFIVFGDHSRCVKFITSPFVQGADGVKVLKTRGIDPKYAFWALRTIRLPNKGYSRHFQFLRNSRFPVAPLPEQRRVVAKIEELFSDLDAGVAALERVKANLKRYRASVLKAGVEGKLTAKWREQNPSVEPASKLLERILIERRKKWESEQLAKFKAAGKMPPKDWQAKYEEPASPNTTGLTELPKGWCWVSVDQLCNVGTGTTPSRSESRFWDGGTIPWVLSTAVNQPFVDEGSEFVTVQALRETTLRKYPVGTLIVALYGEGKTRGMVSELRIEATINQALGALVFDGSAQSIRAFVKLFLTSNYFQLRRKAAGGMQPNLNLGLVKQIVVPLPPLDEQFYIFTEAVSKLAEIDATESATEINLKRAIRLRQSILKRAFEGKLVPPDPADESADRLLERIKANSTADISLSTKKSKRGRLAQFMGASS